MTSVFRKVFVPIEFEAGTLMEFPDDLLTNEHIIKDNASLDSRLHVWTFEENSQNEDLFKYTKLPLFNSEEDLGKEADRLIIEAVVDRNIVVYDSTAKPNEFTSRLVSLLAQCMRRNLGGNVASLHRSQMTDIFLRRSCIENFNIEGLSCTFHGLRDDLWDDIEELYLDLGGSLHSEDRNLVIALSLDLTTFVNPVRDEKSGLIILDKRRVMAGSF